VQVSLVKKPTLIGRLFCSIQRILESDDLSESQIVDPMCPVILVTLDVIVNIMSMNPIQSVRLSRREMNVSPDLVHLKRPMEIAPLGFLFFNVCNHSIVNALFFQVGEFTILASQESIRSAKEFSLRERDCE
jgi:hypothetical protein